MNIAWLPEAIRTFDSQIAYIAERDPRAAIEVGDRIMATVTLLADAPLGARAGRVAGTRECVVGATPFIVVYRVEADTILILRILHGAKRWPPAG